MSLLRTLDLVDIQKPADQTEQKGIEKTPEAAAVSGVIGGQQNQYVHTKANAVAHAHDQTLSEPDLIAMEEGETIAQYNARVAQIQANRFGFFDSENDKKQVFEKPAKQAIEPMPALSSTVNEGPYNSTVKLNVQITNVPEVSEGVKPEEALEYLDQAFEAGAQAGKPVEQWMTTPNAVNDALVGIGPTLDNAINYFANNFSEKVYRDTQSILGRAGDSLDRTFAYPHSPTERAHIAGNLMPMFFFEGNTKKPIRPETVQQLGLEGMSESELAALAIRKAPSELVEYKMPELPAELNTLEYQQATPELLEAMSKKGRTFSIATEGSDDLRRLHQAGAQGSALGDHITLMENPRKITALEEFLHGTQRRLPTFAEVPDQIAEVHVKDFMMRHARLLGLDQNDLEALEWLKRDAIEKADIAGYTWLE